MKTKLLLLTFSLFTFFANAQWQAVGNNNGFIGDFLGFPSLATSSNNDVYLAYQKNTQKLEVLKLINDVWTSIGTDLTEEETRNINIELDNNNVPYVVFNEKIDGTTNFPIRVLKYNQGNTTWEKVGEDVYVGATSLMSLKFDTNNTPYVAYSAPENAETKISVKKYDGTNWVFVGNDKFSDDSAYLGFDISSNNIPYVCYASFDNGNAGKASVMKFNGTSWEIVGTEGFSPGFSKYHNLSIDSNDVLHVGFQSSGTNNGDSTVMKFNGTSWEVLGTEGMNDYGRYNNFLISNDDKKYIAFDEFSDNGLIVKTFNGTDWVQVGNNVTSVQTVGIDIAKSPNGNLFVTYLRDFDSKLYVQKFDTNTLSIDKVIKESINVHLFPNPAATKLTISLNNNESIKGIKIYNLNGKEFIYNSLKDDIIDISNLSKGIYILKISNNNNIYTKKLIKN